MHLLVGMPATGYLRNFEAGFAAALRRGNRVTLATAKVPADTQPILDRLSRSGHFAIEVVRELERTPTAAFAESLRAALDFWLYLDPRFDEAPALRNRVRAAAPRFARLAERSGHWRPALLRRPVEALIRGIERRLPIAETLRSFLRSMAPDALVLTPLIYFDSRQADWVRAARELRIPVAFAVHSWDNLTTKGRIHEMPDRVLVWNAFQCREAIAIHGVPPDRCVVTGATAYDHWFTMQPTLSRPAFLRSLGLPVDRAVILYLCSSSFIAPDEARWVDTWLAAVRQHPDARVRGAAVIVRPHPQNAAQWKSWRTSDVAVRVFPPSGENPVSDEGRLSYFHSLLHSDVVVGINTSALIEAAILRRPVLTVLAPQYAATQRGTLHFEHLERAAGGLVSVGETLEAHGLQLARALDEPVVAKRSRTFVEQFVRPHGLDVSAGDRFADAITALIEAGPGGRAPGPLPRWAAGMLQPWAEAARAATDPEIEGDAQRQLWFVRGDIGDPTARDSRPRILVAAQGAGMDDALRFTSAARAHGLSVIGAVPPDAVPDRRRFAADGIRTTWLPAAPDGADAALRWELYLRKRRATAVVVSRLEAAWHDALARACGATGIPLVPIGRAGAVFKLADAVLKGAEPTAKVR